MKKLNYILTILLFNFSVLSSYAFMETSGIKTKPSDEKLYSNIAKSILNLDKDTYLVIAKHNPIEIAKSIDKDNYKSFITNFHSSPFFNSHNLLSIEENFGRDIDAIIIKWGCDWNHYQNILILYDDIYLLCLKSMFKENGQVNEHDKSISSEEFKEGLNNCTYINTKNYFYIPSLEADNAICLYRKEHKNFPYKAIAYKEDLVADLKLLSKLFSKNDNCLRDEKLELVAKAMPSLKSEEGKKIAEAMIPIIEKEPVLLESILARKIKITVDVNYESVY